MKILITGGLGFIGAHLTSLLDKEHQITILDNFSNDYPGFAKIYRGEKLGVRDTSPLEMSHRESNLKYRLNLVKKTKAEVIRGWSYERFLNKEFDLIINCGSLAEAILAFYYDYFCFESIVEGLYTLKNRYKCPVLHLSSSMVYGTWTGAIREIDPTNPIDYYGECKLKSEALCTENDIILRPMHVYGIGDSKFPIWMNIERQIEKNVPVNIECADCIYIYDFIEIIKNIVANWTPGTYNISSNIIRDGTVLQKIYPKHFEINHKLGPTGELRGTLDSTKLFKTFNVELKFKTYEASIRDYYLKYENLRSQ